MKKISVLLISLLAATTILTACEKKEATPPAPPAAQQPAPAAATPAPADAMPVTPAETAAPMEAATSALPPSCEAYLAKINECVQKNANNAGTANMLQEQEAQLREIWTKEANKEALESSCQQATDIFTQNAAGMGC